jgi:hypothetical protein
LSFEKEDSGGPKISCPHLFSKNHPPQTPFSAFSRRAALVPCARSEAQAGAAQRSVAHVRPGRSRRPRAAAARCDGSGGALDPEPRGGRDAAPPEGAAATGARAACCRRGATWRGWAHAARTPGGTAAMAGVGGSRVSSPWRRAAACVQHAATTGGVSIAARGRALVPRAHGQHRPAQCSAAVERAAVCGRGGVRRQRRRSINAPTCAALLARGAGSTAGRRRSLVARRQRGAAAARRGGRAQRCADGSSAPWQAALLEQVWRMPRPAAHRCPVRLRLARHARICTPLPHTRARSQSVCSAR